MSKHLFICDRKKCMECKPECTHTVDINHAVNFIQVPAGRKKMMWIEREDKDGNSDQSK